MSVGTSPAIVAAPKAKAAPVLPHWRFSVAQYHEMIRTGILDEDAPVELIEGWIITKMPKNPPHCLSNDLTNNALTKMLPSGYFVRTQQPFTTDDSEPEPDVMVVKGELREFFERHPNGTEIPLIVEIADASLARDRKLKRRLYARAGVAMYWIINVNKRQIEVYTEPEGAAEKTDYRVRRDYHAEEEIPLTIDGLELGHLAVNALLP
ncbi:MAG: Uma2 family endonuclease [Acidobacteria bacterium]|nr:Uma2 family endonuclease [Acidobacteriota bacterium]